MKRICFSLGMVVFIGMGAFLLHAGHPKFSSAAKSNEKAMTAPTAWPRFEPGGTARGEQGGGAASAIRGEFRADRCARKLHGARRRVHAFSGGK